MQYGTQEFLMAVYIVYECKTMSIENVGSEVFKSQARVMLELLLIATAY